MKRLRKITLFCSDNEPKTKQSCPIYLFTNFYKVAVFGKVWWRKHHFILKLSQLSNHETKRLWKTWNLVKLIRFSKNLKWWLLIKVSVWETWGKCLTTSKKEVRSFCKIILIHFLFENEKVLHVKIADRSSLTIENFIFWNSFISHDLHKSSLKVINTSLQCGIEF